MMDGIDTSVASMTSLRLGTLPIMRSGRNTRSTRNALNQGLTLVHFSAQPERFVWDRGCA